jgi:serine/threonine protein kinase
MVSQASRWLEVWPRTHSWINLRALRIHAPDDGYLPGMAEGSGKLIVKRYLLVDVVGRGAMGVVWRARDEKWGGDVAIKELRASLDADDESRRASYARTRREAKAAAMLDHPGIITVHEVVEHEGKPWIVMELVDGQSLDLVLINQGPLSPQVAATIGLQMAEALYAAHQAGVFHRDVKPANVILRASDGAAILTDFGIARIEGGTAITRTGILMGTPAYMSPEQARQEQPNAACDLWSLGASLYRMVEGHTPYGGETIYATLTALQAGDPAPALACGALGPVIDGLLRHDPRDRMDAAQAIGLLRRAADGGHADLMPAVETLEGRIDQIIFCSPVQGGHHLLQGQGMGPVASSLDGEALKSWSRTLYGGKVIGHHEASVSHSENPPPRLVTVRLGAGHSCGAVLRIIPTRNSEGLLGQLVHALIGPASLVDATFGLCMSGWAGWLGAQQLAEVGSELSPLNRQALLKQLKTDERAFRSAGYRQKLTAMLTDVLADPSACYQTVITDGNERIALAHALVRLMSAVNDDPPWTIAIGAAPHAPEIQPRLLIFDYEPSASGGMRHLVGPPRRALRTDLQQHDDVELVRAARSVIASFAEGVMVRPPTPMRSRAQAIEWATMQHASLPSALELLRQRLQGKPITAQQRGRLDEQSEEEIRAEIEELEDSALLKLLRDWHEVFKDSVPDGRGTFEFITSIALVRSGTARCLTQSEVEHANSMREAVAALRPRQDDLVVEFTRWRTQVAEVSPESAEHVLSVLLLLGFEFTVDGIVSDLVRTLPLRSLLEWFERSTDQFPAFAVICLGELRSRQFGFNERSELRRWLWNEGKLGTIQQISGDLETQVEIIKMLLRMTYAYGMGRQEIDDALPHLTNRKVVAPWIALADLASREAMPSIALAAYRQGITHSVMTRILKNVADRDLIMIVEELSNLSDHKSARSVLEIVQIRLSNHGSTQRISLRQELHDRSFLAAAILTAYQADTDGQVDVYLAMLGSAYGESLELRHVEEVLASANPMTPALEYTLVLLAVPEARGRAITSIAVNRLESAGIARRRLTDLPALDLVWRGSAVTFPRKWSPPLGPSDISILAASAESLRAGQPEFENTGQDSFAEYFLPPSTDVESRIRGSSAATTDGTSPARPIRYRRSGRPSTYDLMRATILVIVTIGSVAILGASLTAALGNHYRVVVIITAFVTEAIFVSIIVGWSVLLHRRQ